MTEYARLAHAPTKSEHDAVVTRRGRNYTDHPMREARPVDNDTTDSANPQQDDGPRPVRSGT